MQDISIIGIQRQARRATVIGALFCAIGAWKNFGTFFQSYLFSFLVFSGIALGALGILLTFRLTGGAWGRASLPVLRATVRTLPWVALLFIPVLIGSRSIYSWADPGMVWTGHVAAHKALFFNFPFFIARSVIYFGFWCWIGRRVLRIPTSPPSSGTGGTDSMHEMLVSGVGLTLTVLAISFASFDWIMSLEPYWSSSIYGAMILMGDGLTALAFVIVILNWLAKRYPEAVQVPADTAHDLGNLMLAFIMLWAYMALSQYLIIWSGNLPEEIGWYIARNRGGWQVVAALLVLLIFVLPFFLLLARKRKRKLESLAVVAWIILLTRYIDVYWLVVPDFSGGRFRFPWIYLFTPLLVGGAWFSIFCTYLKREAIP